MLAVHGKQEMSDVLKSMCPRVQDMKHGRDTSSLGSIISFVAHMMP